MSLSDDDITTTSADRPADDAVDVGDDGGADAGALSTEPPAPAP